MFRWLCLNLLIIGVTLAGSLYIYEFHYDRLPERVPIHWNWRGEPDAWSDRADVWKTFLLMPATMAGVLVLFVVLPWVSPKQFKIESFRAVYDFIVIMVMLLFAYLQAVILLASMEEKLSLFRLLMGGLFLFFALTGNVLGRIRRNFWMGVRTPWTLASDTVWNQTHRLAAWLFVAGGLLGGLAAILNGPPWFYLIPVLIALLVPVVYSLVLYKRLEKQGKL
jgi:uncharacterized membrane protein